MERPDTVTDRVHRQLIEDYLGCHNTMTIATCNFEGPWAAAVFYAHDSDFSLYFKSDPETRHMRDILECPDVAVTIHDDGQNWNSIRGLQIFGSCKRVREHDLSKVNRHYIEKFSFLGEVTEHAGDAQERILADRLKNTPFFQMLPSWIRFIDNTRGFGFKTEIQLEL